MRIALLITTLTALPFLAACRAPDAEPAVAEADLVAEALERVEALLAETIRRADAAAQVVDRTLAPYPLMTPAEENALRRYLNDAHVARARALGVRAPNRAALDSLVAAGRLVQLEDSTRHWIVRPSVSPAWVVPSTRALLAELGERFQARLDALGLPPYRIEVTSALRTTERQAALQGRNANAAAVSSHEFGTTVDISYAAFAPPAELPPDFLAGAPEELRPHLERIGALALESVSARKSREMAAILGDVLREAQGEGLVLVIYERQQTVYHLTTARTLP